MKTLKITSIIVFALLVSTLTVKASSPFVDVMLTETPTKSFIQVSAAESVEAYVSIVDDKNRLIYNDRIDSKSASIKIFNFSNLEDGNYIFRTTSEYMNLTKSLAVNNSKVEVMDKDIEYKPIFIVEEDLFKINFFNQEMEDIELSLENSKRSFYEGEYDGKSNYKKQLDISNLLNGEYYARLKVGDKIYHHYFQVN